MKIRRITIENNKILWSITLDFVNINTSEVFDTIIFVWENWTWKSTLLNIIYNFSQFYSLDLSGDEKRIFEVEFNDEELSIIKTKVLWGVSTIFVFEIDTTGTQMWSYAKVSSNSININWNIFSTIKWDSKGNLLKSIFSDVSINFNSGQVDSVRNSDVDTEVKDSKKSSENISNEITQMLVDIWNKDAWELQERVIANLWKTPTDDIINVRTKRFQKAFNKMFSSHWLEYEKVQNLKPIFVKNSNEIEINNLSSWEKQIVFRWWFLLKDKNSINNAVVLVDEPEISLHPIWQKKILNFYQNLFKDDSWKQTSQVFISTHSPYILQDFDMWTWWLFVFPWWKRIDTLRKYIWDLPSLWVVNYVAFNLSTIELHNELYWYIQYKTGKYKEEELETYLEWKWFLKCKSWTNEKGWTAQSHDVTLQTFIRHKIHHPENKTMQSVSYTEVEFKQSIDEMIKLIEDIDEDDKLIEDEKL